MASTPEPSQDGRSGARANCARNGPHLLSSRPAQTARDPAVEVPNPKTQIPGKASKYQNPTEASATLGIETLGLPWDLALGVWDFHCERSLGVCAPRDDKQLLRISLT